MLVVTRVAALFALALCPAYGADQQAANLAPGKPAGVQQAQNLKPNDLIFVGALLLVAVGGLYLATTSIDKSATTTGTNR